MQSQDFHADTIYFMYTQDIFCRNNTSMSINIRKFMIFFKTTSNCHVEAKIPNTVFSHGYRLFKE